MTVMLGLSSTKMRCLGEAPDGVGDLGPVALLEPAVAQPGGVDPCLGRQQPLADLGVAHLQGEEEHRDVGLHRGVGHDAEGEAGLAHAGPGAHHEQVRGLQSGQPLVEVGVAGGHAGDALAPAEDLLQTVEAVSAGGRGSGAACRRPGAGPPSNTSDSAWSTDLLHVLGQRVAELGDLAGHADEPAQQGVLLDDAGVAGGVGGGGGVGLQRDEGGGAADGIEEVGPAQLVGHRDGVGRLAPLVEGRTASKTWPWAGL